ncbi:MAG: hypothetical protein NW205_03485 [Hyphomicrobiaceae bacterium]|nr:hypothetical protein [Hyphomicrobiaceae bacterium]
MDLNAAKQWNRGAFFLTRLAALICFAVAALLLMLSLSNPSGAGSVHAPGDPVLETAREGAAPHASAPL